MALSRDLADELGQLPHPGTVTHHTFESKTRPGVVYTVAVLDGAYDCDCPGFRITSGNCTHVKELRRSQPMSNLPAVREVADIVPEGYQPLDLRPPNRLPEEAEFQMMTKIAGTVLQAGGMVPASIKTPQAALAVMLAGHELGMPPMTSLRRIFIVNGKTELETQGLMGLVKAMDPSAHFIFHRYSNDGADVELIRGGRSVIRCSYTQEDRDRSKQGQRKVIASWRNANGKNVPVFAKDESGNIVYEDDPESPWFRYPRDMYAYNAVKRCCRLGAPDCINQIGGFTENAQPAYIIDRDSRAIGDEDAAPRPELTEALVNGELDPADVFIGTEPDVEPPAPEREPEPEPKTPSDILNVIAKQDANRARTARGVMPYLYGTGDLLKLTKDQRADYITKLLVWLHEPEHDHYADNAYAPDGRFICARCGLEIDVPDPGVLVQERA